MGWDDATEGRPRLVKPKNVLQRFAKKEICQTHATDKEYKLIGSGMCLGGYSPLHLGSKSIGALALLNWAFS